MVKHLAITLSLLLLCSVSSYGAIILTNPSFEDGTLNGWSSYIGTYPNVATGSFEVVASGNAGALLPTNGTKMARLVGATLTSQSPTAALWQVVNFTGTA